MMRTYNLAVINLSFFGDFSTRLSFEANMIMSHPQSHSYHARTAIQVHILCPRVRILMITFTVILAVR